MKGHTRNIAGYICQSFLTEHNKLIEKYNNTWSLIVNLIVNLQ